MPSSLCRTAFVAVAGCAAASQAALTVLPLGDSITDGYNVVGGYRTRLYGGLAGKIDFVGSQSGGPASLPDQSHEGHSGYKISEITNNLNGVQAQTNSPVGNSSNGGYWITGGNGTGRAAVSPDVILLMIGTNDILQKDNTAAMADRLDTLITTLVTLRPDAQLLVGSILPINRSGISNGTVTAYNAAIGGTIVPAHAARGEHVYFVDQYANFTTATGAATFANIADGVHPTQAGYNLIADTWATAIAGVPEPTSLAGVAVVAGITLRRRRQAAV